MRVVVLLLLPVLLAACSLLGREGQAEVEVMYLFETPEASRDLDFRAVVEAGGELRTLIRDDFSPLGDRQASAESRTLPADDAARLTCSVARNGARTEGSITIPFEDAYRYRVTCAVQAMNPADACFGCRGSETVDLDPALGFPPEARLHLVWGGDPIENPPVY